MNICTSVNIICVDFASECNEARPQIGTGAPKHASSTNNTFKYSFVQISTNRLFSYGGLRHGREPFYNNFLVVAELSFSTKLRVGGAKIH